MLNDWGNLTCAHCGGDYLHHLEIQVFARPKEDGKTYRTALDAATPKVAFPHASLSGNPSSRRSGVKILFDCELCNGITALTIAQHKGVTMINTERASNEDFAGTGSWHQSGESHPPAPPY